MASAARSGAYLTAIEYHGERIAELLERMPGRESLATRARGTAIVGRALMALDRGRDDELRSLLREACAIAPELHDQPELMAFRIRHHLPTVTDSRSYAVACLRCANAWPDGTALMAHWLRAAATLAAIRARRVGPAIAALRDWPLAGLRSCAVRVLLHQPWRLRNAFDDLRAQFVRSGVSG